MNLNVPLGIEGCNQIILEMKRIDWTQTTRDQSKQCKRKQRNKQGI